MFHKIIRLLIGLTCLMMVFAWLSCPSGQSLTSKGLELKLEKAPRLNEPVNLTCIRQATASDNGTHEKITLQFVRVDPKTGHGIEVPAQEVMAGGSLNWEGNMTGEPMEFSATIKFPYEGNWRIRASSTQRSRDEDTIYLNITEDSSSFGWPPDYRPFTSPFPGKPTEQSPITIELDIPKPPPLDEPVQLTWALNSIRDIDEVISEVKFYHMEGTDRIEVPAVDVLIEGDLAWKGSLKTNNPLNFSATVKFPLEGDWVIGAIADSYVEQQPINAGSGLYLHIDKDKSRWGWTERHPPKPYEGPPPEPIIPGS